MDAFLEYLKQFWGTTQVQLRIHTHQELGVAVVASAGGNEATNFTGWGATFDEALANCQNVASYFGEIDDSVKVVVAEDVADVSETPAPVEPAPAVQESSLWSDDT